MFAKRLTEEILTPKARAACGLDIPRQTASTIFRLKSTE